MLIVSRYPQETLLFLSCYKTQKTATSCSEAIKIHCAAGPWLPLELGSSYSAPRTSLLALWLLRAQATFPLSSHPEGHYAKVSNTQETTGLSWGHSWFQASCGEFPRRERIPTSAQGETWPPLCPAWGHASWVTMSWDALARPCEALESSQEKEVGAPGGPPKIPTSLLHHAPVPSCPVSPGLLQNSAISEGPPAALASRPFCPQAKPFTQPDLSTAQNITLRIRIEANPGNRTHLLRACSAVCLRTARAQMLGNVNAMTKTQGCASAYRAHSLADSLSLFISIRASASPADMFTKDHKSGEEPLLKIGAS